MKCPFCGHTEDRVVDSRVGRDGEFIRRRRECLRCHRRYTTYEYVEDVLPHVVKRAGRREYDAAVQRIGGIGRLELDQSGAPVKRARHGAQRGGD